MEYYQARCDRHLRLTKRDETQTHVELFSVWTQGDTDTDSVQ